MKKIIVITVILVKKMMCNKSHVSSDKDDIGSNNQ